MTTTAGADYTTTSPALGLDHPECYCNWIVARTRPKCEHSASSNLNLRGLATFYPTFARYHRTNLGRRTAHYPLYPGYLFVAHKPGTSWRPIYETPGIASLLRIGANLQRAHSATVKALQDTEPLRAKPLPPHAAWHPGDPCRLTFGPLQTLPAAITTIHGNSATLAIMMLGELRTITTTLDALTPIRDR